MTTRTSDPMSPTASVANVQDYATHIMDYSSYFATTPNALQYFGLPHTTAYPEDAKLDPVDPVDAAFFPPYDFRFSQPQQHPQQNTSIAPPSQASPLLPPPATAIDGSPPALPAPGLASLTSVDSGIGLDTQAGSQANEDLMGRTRSSSEEKESLTPAQSRRKAQNRAAQRAFRERKERHVKDLEAKLSALESSATSLATDNERLKLALQRATTENEILRATSSNHRLSIDSSMDGSESGMPTLGGITGAGGRTAGVNDTSAGSAVAAAQALLARSDSTAPQGPTMEALLPSGSFPPEILATSTGLDPAGASGSPALDAMSSNPLYAALTSSAPSVMPFTPHASRAGTSFLPAAATWDLIQAHPLVKRGVVDVADICDALRGTARCDGQGPVFREEMVWRAVEEARRGGGDELI